MLPLVLFALTSIPFGFAQTLYAVSGTLVDVTTDNSLAGCSSPGAAFVTGFTASDSSVTVSTTIQTQGLYNLEIEYAAPYGDKQAYLTLNGATSGSVSFTSGTTWTNASAGQLLLNAGTNTIGILDDWGYYDICAFYLTPATPPPPHNAHNPPINPAASTEAKNLLAYIQKQYANESAIISGQQAGTYGSGDPTTDSLLWVQQNVGVLPAMGGFDFIDYSPSRVEFQGNVSNNTEQAMAWDKAGGIVAFVWHWNAPTDLINNATEPWWSGFYTAATTFNISSALAEGPSGADYQLLLRDIDAIAVQLLRLQAANIPILFRFLHEADGGWFWWGAQGPAAAIQLFQLGVDRWTNYHGINNIIWVWNSATPSWYPGSTYVDILTYDSYPATGDHGPVSGVFDGLVTLGNDTKVVALAEVGSIPDPSLLKAYYANWAYFCTWTGTYIDDGVQNPLSFLKQVYDAAGTITLANVGLFKGSGGTTTTITTTSTTTTKATTSTSASTTTSAKTTTTTTSSKKTTTTSTTTHGTTTSTTATKTTTTTAAPQQTHWGQCAGIGYSGPTVCAPPYTCQYSNPYYSQCL